MRTLTPIDAGQLCQLAYPPKGSNILPASAGFLRSYQSAYVTGSYSIDATGRANISFAGTRNIQDVIDDLDALPLLVPGLGHVHAGFYHGMRDFWNWCVKNGILHGIVNTEGHSLGGAHAQIFAALCVANKISLGTVTLLESPRVGYEDFCQPIRDKAEKIFSFRNARDPVPDLPACLPYVMPYADLAPRIDLRAPADSIDPLDDHLLTAVLPGLEKWWSQQTISP